MAELLTIIFMLFFFAYCSHKERLRKNQELKVQRQLEEKRRQQELEWEQEAKKQRLEQEALLRKIEHEEEMSKQLAAERAAEPMIINLTITEKDASGMEIGAPKPLSLKLTLDEETAARLVKILRG